MTTQTIQRIERINPEEHAHLLLGFLKIEIRNLDPAAAVEQLHDEVFDLGIFRLEKLAHLTVTYFTKNGSVDRDRFEEFYEELLNELKRMKDNWVRRQLSR